MTSIGSELALTVLTSEFACDCGGSVSKVLASPFGRGCGGFSSTILTSEERCGIRITSGGDELVLTLRTSEFAGGERVSEVLASQFGRSCGGFSSTISEEGCGIRVTSGSDELVLTLRTSDVD